MNDDDEIVPGPLDAVPPRGVRAEESIAALERQARRAHIERLTAMVGLSGAGIVCALTGHESVASTVLGGLLMMVVPSATPAQRRMMVVVGAAMGAALGETV